jgi:hypothetical protein
MMQPRKPVRFEAAPPQVLVASVPIFQLARFRRLMALEGWVIDLPRMCVDRIYAFERIALAHTSAMERLRQAALDLFGAYDRHAVAGGSLH